MDKFYNSPLYSLAVAVVCILCHSLNIPVVGAALLTLLLVPSLLFCKNSFVLVPFLLMCSFVMSQETMPQSGYYNSPSKIAVLCILLVFIVAALIFNLVYYGKWRKVFKKGYLTVSLCLVSGALTVGGIFSDTFTMSGVVTSLTVAVTMFLPYSMLVNCGEYNGKKTVEYFGYAVIAVAVVIAAAILQQFYLNDFDMTGANPKAYCYFGYAGPNTAAAFVLISIPMTFYFVYTYKHGYLFMPLVALETLCPLATESRASAIVAVPGVLIVSIVLLFVKKRGRLGYYITMGIAAIGIVVLCVKYWDTLSGAAASVFENGISDSGRFDLWKVGYDGWKSNPIFGVGYWFLHTVPDYRPAWQSSYHCTPLTYLFVSGIVGLAAYVYHRYKTIRLTFSAKLTVERVFVALSVLVMLLNALLDVGMNSPQHLLFYSVMLALIECDVKAKKAEKATDNSTESESDGATEVSLSDTSSPQENTVTEGEI